MANGDQSLRRMGRLHHLRRAHQVGRMCAARQLRRDYSTCVVVRLQCHLRVACDVKIHAEKEGAIQSERRWRGALDGPHLHRRVVREPQLQVGHLE